MRSRNLKIVLKEDAKEIFNPMEEKNKFLKRLYKENITPPKKTLCKSLFPVFQARSYFSPSITDSCVVPAC